jgi:hypothetical protein
MRLHGFHVVVHPSLGTYLGDGPARPEFGDLPFARQIWSSYPNLRIAAPAFRDVNEVDVFTDFLWSGWRLHEVVADFMMNGQALASMRNCLEAGLEPWLPGPAWASYSFCRTPHARKISAAIQSQSGSRCAVTIRMIEDGIHWRIEPRERAGQD